MRIAAVVRLIAGAVAAVVLGACAATGTAPVESMNPTGADLAKGTETEEAQEYRFFPGDELSVRATNRPELTVPSVRVDPYGYIQYPYVGRVEVRNLTSDEVAERIVRALQEKDYYKRVDLGVNYIGSKEQFVYVLGEVKKPGPISFTGRMTLVDALGLAGGQTYDSEMSTVLFIRGRMKPPGVVKMNLASFGDPRSADSKLTNFTLMPGDVVYVPDSVITSVQRFMNRMFDILRPIVLLETGIVLYDSVERILSGGGRYPPRNNNTNTNTIIINPLNRD